MNRQLDLEKRIARELALHYERGMTTRAELFSKISDYVLEPGFFELIDRLPPEVVEHLRAMGAHPEAHPEDFIDGMAGVLLSPTVTQEMFEEMKRCGAHAGYWTGRLLREHFFPGLPMPAFETMKLDGTVSDAMLVDDVVVIFGSYDYFIRKNPIHLVPPSGARIVTSVVRRDKVLILPEEVPSGLSDAAYRRFLIERSRNGLFLGSKVRSPSEVPPGTEVWVERSNPEEIMPLEEVRRRRS